MTNSTFSHCSICNQTIYVTEPDGSVTIRCACSNSATAVPNSPYYYGDPVMDPRHTETIKAAQKLQIAFNEASKEDEQELRDEVKKLKETVSILANRLDRLELRKYQKKLFKKSVKKDKKKDKKSKKQTKLLKG